MTTAQCISSLFKNYDAVITSTGKMSRIAWDIYKKEKYEFAFFPMQGSMGCSLAISLGIALNGPSKRVLCLIGDGSLLMKLGSLATVFDKKPKNLHIIVLNNGQHESTGGQPTSFNAIKKWLPIKIIDVEPNDYKLDRPNISCEQITKEFRERI